MIIVLRGLTMALALVAGLASAASGQETAAPSREDGTPRRPAERRFGEGVARVVQKRLQLTDAQLRRLGESNQQFARQRQGLVRRERQIRLGIRRELAAGDSAAQGRVATLLDEIIAVQRERLDLVAAEQRELAQFLTPVQRARYLELQEQVRRRVERAAHERRGRGSGTRGGRP